MTKYITSLLTACLFIASGLTAQSGLCTQAEVDVLTADPAGAVEIATDCFTSCLISLDQEACMAECLGEAYPDASDECLSCGVNQVDCVTANCVLACLNPNSAACQECVFNNCSQGFLICIGDPDGDGYTEDGGDCDNEDTLINPAAYDVPNDGIDQDCDGEDTIVGIAENEKKQDAEIQYLPNLGYRIKLPQGTARFEVYDLTGRLIQGPELINQGENTIPNTSSEKGIFILKLYNEELIMTAKVIVR